MSGYQPGHGRGRGRGRGDRVSGFRGDHGAPRSRGGGRGALAEVKQVRHFPPDLLHSPYQLVVYATVSIYALLRDTAVRLHLFPPSPQQSSTIRSRTSSSPSRKHIIVTMNNAVYFETTRATSALHRIGAGFCGTVWSDADIIPESVAIKREDGGQGRSLQNDSAIHQKLLKVYGSKSTHLFAIPLWHGYISTDDTKEIIHRFPQGYKSCNILLTERIPPLPEVVRQLLIDKYCPPTLVSSIAADPNNHDCLVRPYLGKRRRHYTNSTFRVFSLRNFPLHLDQMEDLGLDTYEYAFRIAEALAFMHWSAQVDANDVEFVLAPAKEPALSMCSPVIGDHCLWILDFDCCRPMAMDDVGLEQAARAFWRNDPFYPRPGKESEGDVRLWTHFKHSYLEESSKIIGPEDTKRLCLSNRLISIIEAGPLDSGHRCT